jgi:transcriptional regulator with XRE-family HTH domain
MSLDPALEELGNAIRRRRVDQRLTLEELAPRARVSSRHLGEIERGNVNPRWLTVLRLACALGVPMAEFMRDSSEDS